MKNVEKKAGDIVTVSDGSFNRMILSNGDLKYIDFLLSLGGQYIVVATGVGGLPNNNDTIIQNRYTKEVFFVREYGLKFVDRCNTCGAPNTERCPECGKVKPHTCCR